MGDKHVDPQTTDLTTGQRLATTARAVVQGIKHALRGEHDTQSGENYSVDLADAQAIIESWPVPQKKVAEQMLAKYGQPNEVTPTKLIWYNNRPWKRTEITSDVVEHHWPTLHSDFLTQTINYRVPAEMFHMIAQFDGSVVADRTRGEVSARCDSEAANVLAMNMVHEIVTGKRDVESARHTSEENTVAYNLGRDAPYAERILFELPEGGTQDLDHSAVSDSIARQLAGKAQDVAGESHEPTERKTSFGEPSER